MRRYSSQITAVAYIIIILLFYLALDDYNKPVPSEIVAVAGDQIVTVPGDQIATVAGFNTNNEDKYNIYIDLTESLLYLFKGDKLVKKYPVAQGKPSTPSPIGIWEINSKARNWGTGFGTRWLGLNVPWGKYGIHGTNRPGSIGHRASHGCFRMRNKDVEELYSLVPYKTTVIVYGGPYGNIGSYLERLSPGDRKSQVAEVQKRLKSLGYYNGSVDGIYGEGMKAALIKFKKDKNLPLTHYVDSVTYEALGIITFE